MTAPALFARISSGASPVREKTFSAGQPQDPMSVGTAGQWPLTGAGVREIHAYVHFDGHEISVLSTDDADPARLDGVAVPRAWTIIPIPAVVSFGKASIMFGIASGEPATRKIALPTDLAATIVEPARPRELFSIMAEPVRPLLASNAKIQLPPPTPSTAPMSRSLRIDGPTVSSPGAVSEQSAEVRSGRGVKVRRAMLAGAAIGTAALVGYSYLRSTPGATYVGSRPTTASSTAGPPSATTVPSQTLPRPSASYQAPPGPSADSTRATAFAERAAADAMVRGEEELALGLYTKLAAAQPHVPAFAAAREILERRAKAGRAR